MKYWAVIMVIGLCNLCFAGVSPAQEKAAIPAEQVDSVLEELDKKREALGLYYMESTSTEFRGTSEQRKVVQTTKIWIKGKYARIESQTPGWEATITIHHPDTVYQYDPRKGVWCTSSLIR